MTAPFTGWFERTSGFATYPHNVGEVLMADTPALQKAGWSQPPGTRWIPYWRAEGAFDTSPKPRRRRRSARDDGVDTALLALTSDARYGEVLPHVHDTIRRAESIHRAPVAMSDPVGEQGAPRASRRFTGRDERGDRLGNDLPEDFVTLAGLGRRADMGDPDPRLGLFRPARAAP